MTIYDRIKKYDPKGGLIISSELFLALSKDKHEKVREHSIRVAILAEKVAKEFKLDSKAAFFAGLLHDIGKLVLPFDLFNGRDISKAEYDLVKSHAEIGFNILCNLHEFVAVCCGIHHNMYFDGYGIQTKKFPKKWGVHTQAKALHIALLISICDFIDAFTTRNTTLKSGETGTLKDILYSKYPDGKCLIDTALKFVQLPT